MTEQQQHPITPPPELVEEWCDEWYRLKVRINTGIPEYVATQAARWGADQELEACCEWLKAKEWIHPEFSDELRAAMRPKPPSLAVKALIEFESHQCAMETNGCDTDLLRAALKRLQELESNG